MNDKKKVGVVLGIGAGAVLGLVALAGARAKYPPYVPPVGKPPQPEIPPGLVFSMLLVSPSIVVLGNSVAISVMATNTSTSPIDFNLYLGPDTGIVEKIALAPSEQQTYSWIFKPTELGYYSVWAGSLHNMFQVVEEGVPPETPAINGTTLYTVSGWTVYSAYDGRGRVYRYGLAWSVVEYWIESDGVHRCQIDGTTPFGVWPQHSVFPVGSLYYDVYVAMFSYMDDGYPEGYKSEGWWTSMIGYCAAHPEESGTGFCSYSPYTYPVVLPQ